MILALRRRHRLIVFGLTLLVPAAFAIGLRARTAIPELNRAFPNHAEAFGHRSEIWTRNDLWAGNTFTTRLLREDANTGRLTIELNSKEQILHPDLLVYWVTGERKIPDTLPDDAILLGSFVGSSPVLLGVPAQAANRSGMLVLYSLADHEVIAVSKPFSPTNQR